MRIPSTRSASVLNYATHVASDQPSVVAVPQASPAAKATSAITAATKTNRIGDKAYTEDEDQYIVVLKEEEEKDWRQIYAAMQEKFPEKNRSQGSIQVRYSRSLKKGASSRPKACKNTLSGMPLALAGSAATQSSQTTVSQIAASKAAAALDAAKDVLPQTRSGRVTRDALKSTSQRAAKSKSRTVARNDNESNIKAVKADNASLELNEADIALLAAAMADLSRPADWDMSKQGQPPMSNLRARSLGTSEIKTRGNAAGSGKRRHDDSVSVSNTATASDLPAKSPRQRLIEEMTEKERAEREAKRPKLPIRRADDKNWLVMHPVELGKYAEDDTRVAWVMKFPGPFRILERHVTRGDHVRLRGIRPGELQIAPPNSDFGIWEWVGADTERLGLHRFENHPYGQNWILRSTVDDRQRRVGGDYYLVNGTARTCN